MPDGPVRRGQLIEPHGVGSMIVARNGVSLICAGLDAWFKQENPNAMAPDIDEYRIQEWRLERELGIDHLRLPPDYRSPWKYLDIHTPGRNVGLTVPFLRFPQWHHCSYCDRLERFPLTLREMPRCPACHDRGFKNRRMAQVRFIAICEQGHIQDFPWREWVHRTAHPTCRAPLELKASGGTSTLAGQKVVCKTCKVERSLQEATFNTAKGSGLTRLLSDEEFTCPGERPWLGYEPGENREGCGHFLYFSLRNATSVYYAVTRSSIFLPRGDARVPEGLINILENPPVSSDIEMVKGLLGDNLTEMARLIHGRRKDLLDSFTTEQVEAGLRRLLTGTGQESQGNRITEDTVETAFRREEYQVLREKREESYLRIRPVDLSKYAPEISTFFGRMTLIDKLRETRALAGFNRRLPNSDRPLEALMRALWREMPDSEDNWLPAHIVYGEGIYLELEEERLQTWLQTNAGALQERLRDLNARYQVIRTSRGYEVRPVTPRLVLIHTLAHLLINRLVFESGYSSTALRERLYVSDHPAHPMAGLLLYTASGDADGSMGGLVRMGQPGLFEPVLIRALEAARWCSTDPVCMETGQGRGQGPDSCNLAACHNCALLPETSCEEYNRLLDRAHVIGDVLHGLPGYFDV